MWEAPKIAIEITQDDEDDIYTRSYKGLWLLVVERAFLDIIGATNEKDIEYHRQRAEYWFFTDEGNDVGSWRWVCEALNWSHDYMTRGIRAAMEKAQKDGLHIGKQGRYTLSEIVWGPPQKKPIDLTEMINWD